MTRVVVGKAGVTGEEEWNGEVDRCWRVHEDQDVLIVR